MIAGTKIPVDQLKPAVQVGVDQNGRKSSFRDRPFWEIQEAIDYVIVASKLPQTELRNAVLGRNWSTAKNLLEGGASPHGSDVDGRTLLDHAKKRKEKISSWLIFRNITAQSNGCGI